MDIPREKKRSPKKYILSGLAIAAVGVTTVGLSRLKPAAPRVDRAAIWFGNVEKGELVRQVRGPGTLVPEGMRFVSALNSGRVEEKLRLPGDTVSAETVILRMTNPDIELQALAGEPGVDGRRQPDHQEASAHYGAQGPRPRDWRALHVSLLIVR